MSSEDFIAFTIQVIFKTIAKIDQELAERFHNQPGIKPDEPKKEVEKTTRLHRNSNLRNKKHK